jgi:hypothetical protein
LRGVLPPPALDDGPGFPTASDIHHLIEFLTGFGGFSV